VVQAPHEALLHQELAGGASDTPHFGLASQALHHLLLGGDRRAVGRIGVQQRLVARLRHQIQEHQRSVTHAVTNAFVDRRDQWEIDGSCADSVAETSTDALGACMVELKDSLSALLDIVESDKKDAREVIVR
jgi:hypothetical protein